LKTIFLIATGGTIEKSYCERTGSVDNYNSKIESYLSKIWLPHTRIEVVSLLSKDSRDLTSDDRKSLLGVILSRLTLGFPFIVAKYRRTIRGDSAYLASFFASALTFAHRFLAALAIFALPAADRTRFFTPVSSRFVESPKAFAAARTPLN
jgi:hypothetical protein